MLVSDHIAEACKSAIYFGMLNQSLFSSVLFLYLNFYLFHFQSWCQVLRSQGWELPSEKDVYACVCVHSWVHVCIYVYMTLYKLLSSWEAKLSRWPGTTPAWSLPTYWACLTYRPHIPSRDAPDKQVWAHQSCLVSSTSWSSPLLQQPVGTFKATGYLTQNAGLPDSLDQRVCHSKV